MIVNVAVEIYPNGRSIASALDYPGCFTNGATDSEAIIRIPEALLRYKEWVDSHLPDSWIKDLGDFDVHLEETFKVYNIDELYNLSPEGLEINAFYRHDWKILSDEDIRRGMLTLQWTRADLLEEVAGLTTEHMQRKFEGERWSISGVLRHIANAEFWYLERLSLEPVKIEYLPQDPFERLAFVRRHLNQVLPSFIGLHDVRGVDGEIWSTRKVLRRAIWHEIDHIDHIFKLIARL